MKTVDNFANIGKAVLLQSIGLQKNYIEIEESVSEHIDYDNTACSDCKYKALVQAFNPDSDAYRSAAAVCQNCPKKIFTTKTEFKKVYYNEKNRYGVNGYKPRLKTNAIKLLLALHFFHPDRFGIIKSVDIRELADLLKCDLKTIRNNLSVLQMYSYITFAKTDTYFITLCLNDYSNYYLPAQKGGRGFFVLSKELLKELLDITTLVTLRIYLRELVYIDNLNSSKADFFAVSTSYKDIKRSLPDYCKPNIIKKAVCHKNNIFNITLQETSIRFEINDNYNAKKQKESCLQNYIHMLTDFMHDFNNAVTCVNVNNVIPEKYSLYFDSDKSSHYNLICFKDFELEDLAMLSLQYSYDSVLFAFASVYKSYICKDRKITNLGGLVRTAIVAKLNTTSVAA